MFIHNLFLNFSFEYKSGLLLVLVKNNGKLVLVKNNGIKMELRIYF